MEGWQAGHESWRLCCSKSPMRCWSRSMLQRLYAHWIWRAKLRLWKGMRLRSSGRPCSLSLRPTLSLQCPAGCAQCALPLLRFPSTLTCMLSMPAFLLCHAALEPARPGFFTRSLNSLVAQMYSTPLPQPPPPLSCPSLPSSASEGHQASYNMCMIRVTTCLVRFAQASQKHL